jgi:hypothetical protein
MPFLKKNRALCIVVGLQNLPFPATRAGLLASLPVGAVGLSSLLMLLGDGEILVVGEAF